MKYVLDTHVWIWALLDDARLSANARALLTAEPTRFGLASISLKEAAWHLSHGRIEIPSGQGTWQSWLRRAAGAPSLEILPLTAEVAIESEAFAEDFPNDPADRLIAATAIVHGCALLTADRGIRASKTVDAIW